MEITLYKNTSPNNFLNKVLSEKSVYTGYLREESSVLNPTVMIENLNLARLNYMFIPSFGRYYYITENICVRSNLWRLTGEVDVLMSYRSELLNHEAIIEKASDSDKANIYIDDGDWIVENRKFIKVINFPSGLDDEGEYVLITAGA